MAARTTRIWPGQLISRGLSIASRQATPAFYNSALYTHPSSVSRLFISSFHKSARFSLRTERSLVSRRFRSLRFNSSRTPNSTPHPGNPEPAPSISQRLKRLSREYGWTALGVYLALSALDLPFCFLAVRTFGADRIAHYEHIVIEKFRAVLRIPFPNLGKGKEQEETSPINAAEATAREGEMVWGDQGERVEALNSEANACTGHITSKSDSIRLTYS